MRNLYGKIALHVLGCLAFLSLPILFAPGPAVSWRTITNPFTTRDLFSYLLLIAFFYLNVYVFIPKFYFAKKYFHFVAAIVLFYLIVTAIPFLLVQHMPPPDMPRMPRPGGGPPRPNDKSILFELSHNFFRFAVVLFIALTVKITGRWKLAEKEKLNTELAYLKAQINPHFLFNTLNSIYSLAIEKSDHTATAVIKLSEMMRYVISESHHQYVSLEKEITYVQNYIELQRLRFGTSIPLSVSIKGETAGKRIAPLLLIPFVENAFKYGVNAEENSDIKISIDIHNSNLQLQVYNNKVNVLSSDSNKSGLGIANTKSRLELLYPGNHLLSIRDNVGNFAVSLLIVLQ